MREDVAGASGLAELLEIQKILREPCEPVQQRLRVALQVASMLSEAESARTGQAWIQGLDPQLDDRSPARLLREGDVQEVGPAVIGAARAFLVGG